VAKTSFHKSAAGPKHEIKNVISTVMRVKLPIKAIIGLQLRRWIVRNSLRLQTSPNYMGRKKNITQKPNTSRESAHSTKE